MSRYYRWIVIWSLCFFYPLQSYHKEIPSELSASLRSYVIMMLTLLEHPRDVKMASEKIMDVFIKDVTHTKMVSLTMIPLVYKDPSRWKFNMDFKYKKVRQTKEKELPPLLNFYARKEEIAEGFEASEMFASYWGINHHWKMLAKVGLVEKWVNEKQDYAAAHHLEKVPDVNMPLIARTMTGTVKCAMGWLWDLTSKEEKRVAIECLMQHKIHQEWHFEREMPMVRKGSRFLFDHWIVTITSDF